MALYTVPGPETWELILNRSTGQWGIESEYTEAVRRQEIGRAIVAAEHDAAPVERLTIRFEADSAGRRDAGQLVLQWETTRVRIPVRVIP